MSESESSNASAHLAEVPVRTAIEISIRLGAIALLVGGCLMIIAPFAGIVIWAFIIAIALGTGFEKATGWLGGRRKLAAVILAIGLLALIIVPAVLFSGTLVSGAHQFAEDLAADQVQVPPPPEGLADVPLVGERVHAAWLSANQNLEGTISRLRPQLGAVSRWLLGAAGSAGAGLLQLVASILIACVMLVRSEAMRTSIRHFSVRMAGAGRGNELVDLATGTIQSVVQGIVGVALIQSVLAGAGLAVADIPGAGVWALLVLVAAVVQLPTILVLIPPIAIGFSTLGGAPAVALLVWLLFVGMLDNVLKPLLFGRGLSIPSIVIFLGAIGGMLSMGIVGLFLGAVVLALGFQLFGAWMSEVEIEGEEISG